MNKQTGQWLREKARRTYLYGRLLKLRWKKLDRKYGWRWRTANLFAVLLVLSGVVIPIVQELWQSSRYTLSAEALQLTGHTDPSLAKQLTYDESKQLYQFNKDAVHSGSDAGLPSEIQKASVGAGDKSNAKTYSLDIPKDFTKGVTYHDSNSQLSFKLVPQFKALPGKTDQGHLVFPIDGDNQAVYTLKNNGLKEDIIVPKVTQSDMRFDYALDLPKTMVAKAIPESGGAIGIYSADPSLFGDIQYGSDKDRAAVEKARENADKTHLVFGLPAPVVKDTNGKEAGSARFELNGTKLSVIAEGLKASDGPITIDPSVVVTSTSDFQTGGNNEGMIDFGTSGQITRGGLTGGTMGSWSTTTTFSGATASTSTIAYNDCLYAIGGVAGDTAVNSAPINSNGTLGSWSYQGATTASHTSAVAGSYNGYLYIAGGGSGGAVEYAKVTSGSCSTGSWQTTASLPDIRTNAASAVYNGYFYVMGGYDGSSVKSEVLYAPIKANGSLGSWSTTTSFTTARSALGGFAYNGYLYILGGYNGTSTYYSDAQYAKLNSDGTVGTWAATTSFTTNRAGLATAVYNGYAYVMGGSTNLTSSLNTTQYAQINANGTLGSWRTSSNLSSGVWNGGQAVYNGYLYILGGYTTNSSSQTSTVQYAAIDRAGKPVAFGTLTNNFTTARALACSVAYNGYLYAIGGSTADSIAFNVTTVRYTALNASTGDNGSWSTATALPTARGSAGCTVHNGYLYVIGGYTGSGGTGTTSKAVLYIAINSNGSLAASWTTSGNSLPNDAEFRPGVFTYGTSGGMYLYALGGCDAIGTTCDNTYYAPLDASTGAVGGWTSSGNSLVNQYKARGYAQVGKYLYAFGGEDGTGTAYSVVEYTSINNDGSINAWATTTSLNTAMDFTSGTTVNGCIYSVGGENPGGTIQPTVQYACPAANGTISAWYNAPNLTVATTDMGVTSYNGYIYGVGGYTSGVVATTQFAYVNNGGSGANGAWVQSGNNLAANTIFGASAAYNGYVYVTGGDSGSAAYNTVQYAQISASGDVGTFSTDARTFTTERGGHGTAAYNGYLYILGGTAHGGSPYYGDVQYAPIGPSGALSGNFASTTSFVTGTGGDTGRTGTCVVIYDGYMYTLGGWDGTSNHADTRYAAINSNGTLGAWADSGNNFTGARNFAGCFAANGYMYLVGGEGVSAYNDVQVAQINGNGTLGTWKYTSSFSGARVQSTVAYSNGFAYLTAGCSAGCASNYGDTQYAPIYANGTLGSWQRSTGTVATYSPDATTGTVANGTLYLFGGNSGGGRNAVYYTPLNSIARQARYSKLIDLGVPTNISSVTYNGTLPTSSVTPGVTPISFRAAGNDGIFGSLTSSSAITPGATSCLATNQNYKRYLLVTITLDGSGGQAILPDNASTYSNVTDFTVNYTPVHPPPNIRLRHGQTLQLGNLSPLDTCTP